VVQLYPNKGVVTLEVQFVLFADVDSEVEAEQELQPPPPPPVSDEKVVEAFIGRLKSGANHVMELQHGVALHIDVRTGMMGFCSIAYERQLEQQQVQQKQQPQRAARDTMGSHLLSNRSASGSGGSGGVGKSRESGGPIPSQP